MFIFTLCQIGAEPVLKQEIAREHPEFRFAYSRPGFVTFKRIDGKIPGPDFELRSVFARSFSAFLAKTNADTTDVVTQAKSLSAGKPLRLHISMRDLHPPGDDALNEEIWQEIEKLELWVREAGGSLFLPGRVSEPGDHVLDVVRVEEKEWWIGHHIHRDGVHSRDPGGRSRIVLPVDCPSRAYLKLAEGVRFAQIPIRTGDCAVEIGSAPGGAAYYLLEKGLKVIGIDPGAMDPIIAERFPNDFEQIVAPVADVLREDLPENVQWLLADMNVNPGITMYAVDRLATRLGDGLLGVLLTLKLNQWKISEEIPSFLAHVKAMGMTRVRAKQLSHNRQEFFVTGLTRRGAMRLL